jgi:hypothetical protein
MIPVYTEEYNLKTKGGDDIMVKKSKSILVVKAGVLSSRPVRNEVIGNDDVLNVKIMLGLSKTADEFIDILNGRPLNVYGN